MSQTHERPLTNVIHTLILDNRQEGSDLKITSFWSSEQPKCCIRDSPSLLGKINLPAALLSAAFRAWTKNPLNSSSSNPLSERI